MKKLIVGTFALASFILSANAQETGKMEHKNHHHDRAMMLKGLNLSETQKEQIKTYRQNANNQLMELNKNEDITVKEYRSRKAAILNTQKEQIEKVLTAEQKTQLAQNKAERKAANELAVTKRIDKMKSRLNLSDEQVTKIRATHEAAMEKATAIRENNQLSPEEKRQQLMSLRQEQKSNITQVLTPEQITKMEEMKKERMERMDKKSKK